MITIEPPVASRIRKEILDYFDDLELDGNKRDVVLLDIDDLRRFFGFKEDPLYLEEVIKNYMNVQRKGTVVVYSFLIPTFWKTKEYKKKGNPFVFFRAELGNFENTKFFKGKYKKDGAIYSFTVHANTIGDAIRILKQGMSKEEIDSIYKIKESKKL